MAAKKYIVGQEDQEGIHIQMVTVPVKQDRVNRCMLEASVEGMSL